MTHSVTARAVWMLVGMAYLVVCWYATRFVLAWLDNAATRRDQRELAARQARARAEAAARAYVRDARGFYVRRPR